MNRITAELSDPYLKYPLYETAEEDETSAEYILHFPNAIYKGAVQQDKAHGKGILLHTDNGDYFDGEWINGNYQNGRGKFTTPLQVYEGEIFNGKFHGKGNLKHLNGSFYEGRFENDKFSTGYGKTLYEDGREYVGNYINGSFHGLGKLTKANGDYIDGSFLFGVFLRGFMKKTLQNGYRYEGGCANDKFDGYGAITHVNNVDYIRYGLFENGKFFGGKKPV